MGKYNVIYHDKFRNEYFKLTKKCPSIKKDFQRLVNAIKSDLEYYNEILPKNKYKKIKGLGNIKLPVFKEKKFRFKAIKKGSNS